MKYSESKALAEVGRRLQTWLRSDPGPISGPSPKVVYTLAVARFKEATGVDCEYGFMVDSLFAVGIQADQVGALYFLRIPGKDRQWADKHKNTPTRIDG